MDRTDLALKRVKAYCEAYLEPKRILFVSAFPGTLKLAMQEFERLVGRENCRINHATRKIEYLGHSVKFAVLANYRDADQLRGYSVNMLERDSTEASIHPTAYAELLPLVR